MKDKQIVFCDDMLFVNVEMDTVSVELDCKMKIVHFVDSTGCLSCNLKLADWNRFMKPYEGCNDLKLITIINPRKITEAQYVIQRDSFEHPICIDLKNDFFKSNNMPIANAFHCFLLDENNRVVLIGNPVQNPKIRELYIKTISERLGVERPNDTEVQQAEYQTNMGTFSWRESQKAHFILRNTESESIEIDSIRTSCECTTAVASKTAIAEGDSSVVTVTYKAEQAGDFMREVYVYLHDSEPITMRIEGRAE